jgi:hypothetical protein
MKILAFDIGLKNLSYCLFDSDTNEILDWDLIHLCADVEFYCDEKLKNKKICNKKATHYLEDNYCCNKHKKDNYKEIKKEKKIPKDYAIDIKKNLDERKELSDVDVVLIENQPVLKNPVMKTIQVIIFSYFCFKITNNNIDVLNVSARTKEKLPVLDKKWVNTTYYNDYINQTENTKDKYKTRKIICKEYAKYLLDDKPELQSFLMEHKKQDDLTDSFLMCVYYSNKK